VIFYGYGTISGTTGPQYDPGITGAGPTGPNVGNPIDGDFYINLSNGQMSLLKL
jgi:hypothetical protein